jgi:hypothetical protein
MHSLGQAILKVIDDKKEQQGSSDGSLGHTLPHDPGPAVSPIEANPCLSIGQESLDPLYIVAKRSAMPDFVVRFRKVKKCENRSICRFLCLKAITDGLGQPNHLVFSQPLGTKTRLIRIQHAT